MHIPSTMVSIERTLWNNEKWDAHAEFRVKATDLIKHCFHHEKRNAKVTIKKRNKKVWEKQEKR